ncbi:hypothetical protein EYF80_057865 [Liparis tanakae]|uniref:Uncharacterized protein n=1 Tax=Liparis tanakae TaxID=230148 RepID=A0A4Z2EST4_9TELE|nr:hypothetical protein EYF80_057865 [Liparis tanakae]
MPKRRSLGLAFSNTTSMHTPHIMSLLRWMAKEISMSFSRRGFERISRGIRTRNKSGSNSDPFLCSPVTSASCCWSDSQNNTAPHPDIIIKAQNI